MIDKHHGWNTSFKPIVLGFTLSLIFMAAAYRLVTKYHLPHKVLPITLLSLACIQVIFQFIFFLHIGLESKPRWNLMMTLFMVLVVFIVIGGSMWIMYNLNYFEMLN